MVWLSLAILAVMSFFNLSIHPINVADRGLYLEGNLCSFFGPVIFPHHFLHSSAFVRPVTHFLHSSASDPVSLPLHFLHSYFIRPVVHFLNSSAFDPGQPPTPLPSLVLRPLGHPPTPLPSLVGLRQGSGDQD